MTDQPSHTIALISEIAADPRMTTRLHAAGFYTIDRLSIGPEASASALSEAVGSAWGVIAGGERYDPDALDGMTDLRVILRPGAGFDTIDVAAATQRGILVATTPGANAEAVADLTVGLMLACLRQIPMADQALRAGRWRPDVVMSRDLHRRTVGIVGLGRIGRAVARRLRGFDCRLLGFDPFADPAFCAENGIVLLTLEDLLSESEVVTLHLPLSAETEGLLGRPQFERMRQGSVLINTSRGPIVDEAALSAALDEGRLWSAGLDVFVTEPLPSGHPFMTQPNMVLTGHLASYTNGAFEELVDGAVQAMCEARDGRAPVGAINAEVLTTGGRAD